MEVTPISKVSIGPTGLLVVTPVLRPSDDLEFVYRAARSTRWLADLRALTVVSDARLSHAEAFGCILESAAGEYGLSLVLTKDTDWSNTPPDVREKIKNGAKHAA
jgi:hypothetical protein